MSRASRDEEVARYEAKCEALEKELRQRMATVEGIAAREKADIIAGRCCRLAGVYGYGRVKCGRTGDLQSGLLVKMCRPSASRCEL